MSPADVPEGEFIYPTAGGLATAIFKTTAAGRFKFKCTKTSAGPATIYGKAFPANTIAFDASSADSVDFDV